MSELKGMVVFAVSEPLEDGSFFIKKSIRDGSLAIFDEEKDADRQLRLSDIKGNVVNELVVVRAERAANVNGKLDSLTEHNRLLQLENEQLAKDKAELIELVRKIHVIMRNTKELPGDYTHEDVGELDDRFNEISGLNHKLYLKHIYDEANKCD